MTTGTINAAGVNLLDGPDGVVLAAIPAGAQVDVKIDDGSGWLVAAATIGGETRIGFVDGCFVTVQQPVPPPPPNITGGFTSDVVAAAQASHQKWTIPASVTLAQWALESGFGRSTPPGSNNPFGIKASGAQPFVAARTREVSHGQSIFIIANFRKYDSIGDAFDDHGRLLAQGAPYAPARALLPDARRFADALTGVYATDPNYGALLNRIMTEHDLLQFD